MGVVNVCGLAHACSDDGLMAALRAKAAADETPGGSRPDADGADLGGPVPLSLVICVTRYER